MGQYLCSNRSPIHSRIQRNRSDDRRNLKINMDLYIYYRVRVDRTELFKERIGVIQQQLIRDHGIVAALKRRPEQQQDISTWMEVYLNVPADFETALNQMVETSRLSDLIEGGRHVEHFMDVPVCA